MSQPLGYCNGMGEDGEGDGEREGNPAPLRKELWLKMYYRGRFFFFFNFPLMECGRDSPRLQEKNKL